MYENSIRPLVSVVIPTYNHGRYLGRAMQSVLDQTYTNWEAIVIDNHSTDNTDEIVASFADPRIRYLKIHNNGVIAASRNAGIHAAKGEWIAFLDSDDWWLGEKLKACIESINEKVDFVYHDLEIVSDQPEPFRPKTIKSWQVKSPVLFDLLLRGNAIATSSVVVRAKLLKHLNGMCELTDMIAAEDYNTWLRIAELTNNFLYLHRNLGYYLMHDENISRKNISLSASNAIKEFMTLLSDDQINKVKSNISYSSGRHSFLHGDYKKAKQDFRLAYHDCDFLRKIKILYMTCKMVNT